MPLLLARMLIEMGDGEASFSLGDNKAMKHIDMELLLRLIDSGVMGKLIEIDDEETHVEVFVE